MYYDIVLPYIDTMVTDRLQWVRNILEHKAETDRILFEDPDPENGFILLPDLYVELDAESQNTDHQKKMGRCDPCITLYGLHCAPTRYP